MPFLFFLIEKFMILSSFAIIFLIIMVKMAG